MHTQRNPRECRHGHELQCPQVAAVEHVGPQATQQSIDLGVQGIGLPRRLVERDELHIRSIKTPGKLGVDVTECDDGVPKRCARQVPNELHHHVFHATRAKPIDKVGDVAGRDVHWVTL